MSGWDDRTLLEDLVASGVDDWVYAADAYGIAARTGTTGEALRLLAVGLVVDAVAAGLAIPGEYNGSAHAPWECTRGEAIERIAEAWREWGTGAPTPGAIVWLDLTAEGKALGEAVLNREAS